jgi:hypothetical protein
MSRTEGWQKAANKHDATSVRESGERHHGSSSTTTTYHHQTIGRFRSTFAASKTASS